MATTARSTSIREKLSFEIDQRHSESQCEPAVHDAPANGSRQVAAPFAGNEYDGHDLLQ